MHNKLQVLVRNHCAERNLSARNLAERIGIGYPAALALLRKGAVPRKPNHREALRNELGLDPEAWAQVVAGSQRGGVDIPEEGQLTLQQLVMKALLAQGFTEQSFSKATGIPYPTIMGITRKGAIPRADTLQAIGDRLGITAREIENAVAESRVHGKPTARIDVEPVDGGVEIPEEDEEEEPNLAQSAMDAVHRAGDSIAAFAKAHGIPYLQLSRLIKTGVPPAPAEIVKALEAALALPRSEFAAALAASRAKPVPATPPTRESDAVTPLQAALIRLVTDRKMTVKAFADAADLSVLTATRLLKRGDLPGRATTNLKLRTLLGLGEAEYENLLARSRAALAAAGGAQALAGDDEDGLAPHAQDPLASRVAKLDPGRRKALEGYLSSLAKKEKPKP